MSYDSHEGTVITEHVLREKRAMIRARVAENEYALSSYTINAEAFAKYQRIVTHLIMRDGYQAFQMPKRATCLHEAGHAVVYAAHDVPVRSVSIRRAPKDWDRSMSEVLGRTSRNWGGVCVADIDNKFRPETMSADDLERHARVVLAGVTAEQMFFSGPPREGAWSDELFLVGCLTCSIDPQDQAGVFHRIQAYVEAILATNEAVVEHIATVLSHNHHMEGKLLAMALADVRRAGGVTASSPVVRKHTAFLHGGI